GGWATDGKRAQKPAPDANGCDREPDHPRARADDALERRRVRVDLVRADCAAAVGALERRVYLDQLVEAELRLGFVLALRAGRYDACYGVILADGLAELAVEREALPDAGRLQARPR